MCNHKGLKIYHVNGLAVRANHNTDYTLGGHGSVDSHSNSHSSSGNYISLPSQFEKQVQPLLTVAKKYNLIDDVNSSGKPLFGYTKPMFKGGRNNVLVLQKSGAIQVEFIDDALSKIKSIFGDINSHQTWKYTFDDYENDVKQKKISKVVVKVFTGR